MENENFFYIIKTIIIRRLFLNSFYFIKNCKKQKKFLNKLSIIFELGFFFNKLLPIFILVKIQKKNFKIVIFILNKNKL